MQAAWSPSSRRPARSRRWSAAATTRHPVQPRRPGDTASPARCSSRSSTSRRSKQAARLPRSDHSRHGDRRRALRLELRRADLDAGQLQGSVPGRGDASPGARALAQRRHGAPGAPGRPRADPRPGAPHGHHERSAPLSVDGPGRRSRSRRSRSRRPTRSSPTRGCAPRRAARRRSSIAAASPIETQSGRGRRAWSARRRAYLVTHLMEGVLDRGTGRAACASSASPARLPARPAPPTTSATPGSPASRRTCSPWSGSASTRTRPLGLTGAQAAAADLDRVHEARHRRAPSDAPSTAAGVALGSHRPVHRRYRDTECPQTIDGSVSGGDRNRRRPARCTRRSTTSGAVLGAPRRGTRTVSA